VKKALVGKIATVSKKPLPRSSAVDRAHSSLRGVKDEDDDPIMLLSDDDKAEKKGKKKVESSTSITGMLSISPNLVRV
jgi:hypothetical protein